MADFNSRAHARRDGIFEKILIDIQHFNSRAHARRDSTKRSDKSENTNFNSRAHARRDGVIFLLDEIQIISTHAPTQGATQLEVFMLKKCNKIGRASCRERVLAGV